MRFRIPADQTNHGRLRHVSPAPEGFDHKSVGGDIVISHHGRPAATLRGAAARQFLIDVDDDDPQELMARLTGNYKHGNERTAKNHPRNVNR